MVTLIAVPIDGRAPSGETNAYLLGNGDVLVDPATRTPALDEAVAAAAPEHVAVTHHHPDHAGGVADYAAAQDLTVWARAGRTEDFLATTGIEPDRTLAEGTVIPAGDGVVVRDTPGHAPEHVAFDPVETDGLATGDLAVAEGSVVVGAPGGDMRAYLGSLRRVHTMNPGRLYPGHGRIVDDPRATCARLLSHRLEREARVLAAVRNGARTPREIVQAAYDKDVSTVGDLARATVVAHLEKLAVEGTVAWDGTRATRP